jgi:N-methylhydantoinase A
MQIARNGTSALLGIDTGGTFTDVTLIDPQSGRQWTAKVASTPADPSQAFGNGIAAVLKSSQLLPSGIARVLHGTTVATNLILEGKGARAALLTTAGFKYVLEIGRQDVPRRASLFAWVKPKRPVPPEQIFDIGGRIDPTGAEVEPLDEIAVCTAAREIKRAGITAVAIVFLHSYANADHERRAADLVQAEHPDALISISSDVLPVFREYERSMTTLLNVHVMPVVSAYVERLDRRVTDQCISAPLLLMKSSGGVTTSQAARRTPVETALSGPAAGAIGAAFVGATAGFNNVIAIDIGGTSADISLITNGVPGLTTHGHVGHWPIALPMVDVVTIGAGGGSVARVSENGALIVGPESAGADPGPVCYGHGGAQPTVTDAHLVLGHLPPYLLGGNLHLDIDRARQAIHTVIAKPLGMAVEAAARGILSIADNHMLGAIRVVTVERGHDPRDFALLAFGGAGPLHGGSLARLLGISTVVVPPRPGVLSALGLLVSNLRAEFARTCAQRLGQIDVDQIDRGFAALDDEASAWLRAEHVPDKAQRINWTAAMRYEHQGFELLVPWPGRRVDSSTLAEAIAAFHRMHERLYTFAQPDTPVEIVTLRVDAEGIFAPPTIEDLPVGGPVNDAITGWQAVGFDDGRVECPVIDRRRLGSGARVDGPAILTQLDATTLVLPGQTGLVDRVGNLIVTEQRTVPPTR